VLVDRARREALRLDEVGTAIAASLAVPTTLGTVRARLSREYDVSADQCAEAVDAFVDRLRERGLVRCLPDADERFAARRRYLDLLARALVNLIYPEYDLRLVHLAKGSPGPDRTTSEKLLRDIRYLRPEAFAEVIESRHRPDFTLPRMAYDAHTLVGLARLQHLERLAAVVFAEGVEGDFLEAGVCQGGAAIFLRALQIAYDAPERTTWLADSFAGVPRPSDPVDVARGADYSEAEQPWLAVSRRAVEDNFRTYDLLSDRVRFLEGWFADTLPGAPVERLAILRIDGDLYASTRDVLVALYDRVAPGGFVVVDDYGFQPCATAVDEFLAERGIADRLRFIDGDAVYWRVG
jgi:O-methyltransferase